jgi:hypothetical protein
MSRGKKRDAEEDAEPEPEEDAEEQDRDRRREGVDFSKPVRDLGLADETLGGAFKSQDRGQFGDLSRGGRPTGANRGWADEPKAVRAVNGLSPVMWEWFRDVAASLERNSRVEGTAPLQKARAILRNDGNLPVSRNIREGKPLGARARRSDDREYDRRRYASRGYSSTVRVNGHRVHVDYYDRYDGYDRSIHDSRFRSLGDETYNRDDVGDERAQRIDWHEHYPSAMDDGGGDDSSFPRSSRPRSPDGNVWHRTGRRGRRSFTHPVARDDRPKTRKPDWHELEPTCKPVWEMIDSVLRKDERYAFTQRYFWGMSYAAIARTAKPKMSDRSQARKVVKRAVKKLQARVGKKIPNPFA